MGAQRKGVSPISEQKQTEPEVSIETEKVELGDPPKSFPDINEMKDEMKVYPTVEKIEKLKIACNELLNNISPEIREVASVLGFLISFFPAALYGPLYFRDRDMDKTDALKSCKGNFDKRMRLSEKACSDLRWWIKSADLLYKPIYNTLPEITLFTDASNHGLGAVLGTCQTGGQWTPQEADNHINYLEMFAVFLALQAFHSHVFSKHVCVWIDNMIAVADIGKWVQATLGNAMH